MSQSRIQLKSLRLVVQTLLNCRVVDFEAKYVVTSCLLDFTSSVVPYLKLTA